MLTKFKNSFFLAILFGIATMPVVLKAQESILFSDDAEIIIEDELIGGSGSNSGCWSFNSGLVYSGIPLANVGVLYPSTNPSITNELFEINITFNGNSTQMQAYFDGLKWHIRKGVHSLTCIKISSTETLCYFSLPNVCWQIKPVLTSNNGLNFISINPMCHPIISINRTYSQYSCAVAPSSIIFPNPTFGPTKLRLECEVNDIAKIKILKTDGTIIQQFNNVQLINGSILFNFDITGQQPGLYYVIVYRDIYSHSFNLKKY